MIEQFGALYRSDPRFGAVRTPNFTFVKRLFQSSYSGLGTGVNAAVTYVANDWYTRDSTGLDTPFQGGGGSSTSARTAYFWQTVADVTGTIAANNGKVLFETGSSNNSPDITSVAGSGDVVIGATAGGLYDIEFSVSGAEPNAFGIFVNGILMPGTLYGSGAGTQQNNGTGTLALVAADIVSIRTVANAAAITLQLAGTTDDSMVVGSIKLIKR